MRPDRPVDGLEEGLDHRVEGHGQVLRGLAAPPQGLVEGRGGKAVQLHQGTGQVREVGGQVRPAGRRLDVIGPHIAVIVIELPIGRIPHQAQGRGLAGQGVLVVGVGLQQAPAVAQGLLRLAHAQQGIGQDHQHPVQIGDQGIAPPGELQGPRGIPLGSGDLGGIHEQVLVGRRNPVDGRVQHRAGPVGVAGDALQLGQDADQVDLVGMPDQLLQQVLGRCRDVAGAHPDQLGQLPVRVHGQGGLAQHLAIGGDGLLDPAKPLQGPGQHYPGRRSVHAQGDGLADGALGLGILAHVPERRSQIVIGHGAVGIVAHRQQAGLHRRAGLSGLGLGLGQGHKQAVIPVPGGQALLQHLPALHRPSRLGQGRGQADHRGHAVPVQGDGLAIGGLRIQELAVGQKGVTQRQGKDRLAGVQAMGPQQGGDRTARIAGPQADETGQGVDPRIRRVGRQHRPQPGKGGLQVAGLIGMGGLGIGSLQGVRVNGAHTPSLAFRRAAAQVAASRGPSRYRCGWTSRGTRRWPRRRWNRPAGPRRS